MHKRQGSVNQLHFHAVQGLCSWGNVQEVQNDRLVCSKHCATGYLDCQAVANLPCHHTLAFTSMDYAARPYEHCVTLGPTGPRQSH